MTFGIAPPQPPREPPRLEQLRALWRVERRRQFKVQQVTAALYAHPAPHTQELRVFLGEESDDNLLHSEVARWDFTPLDAKANELRDVLLSNGWTALSAVE